jgi:hypothetical protein
MAVRAGIEPGGDSEKKATSRFWEPVKPLEPIKQPIDYTSITGGKRDSIAPGGNEKRPREAPLNFFR